MSIHRPFIITLLCASAGLLVSCAHPAATSTKEDPVVVAPELQLLIPVDNVGPLESLNLAQIHAAGDLREDIELRMQVLRLLPLRSESAEKDISAILGVAVQLQDRFRALSKQGDPEVVLEGIYGRAYVFDHLATRFEAYPTPSSFPDEDDRKSAAKIKAHTDTILDMAIVTYIECVTKADELTLRDAPIAEHCAARLEELEVDIEPDD